MNLEQQLAQLKTQYEVLAVIDLDQCTADQDLNFGLLKNICQGLYQESYKDNQRLIFTQTQDWFADPDQPGLVVQQTQQILNQVDISNFFVIVLTTDLMLESQHLQKVSADPTPVCVIKAQGDFTRHRVESKSFYQYGSADPVKVSLASLTPREQFLLSKSKTFCIYPWIHLHAYPTGEAYPCCHAEMYYPVGNTRFKSLEDIWYDAPMRELRKDMLAERPNPACTRCYEQELSGFFSGRKSANKHHGHHIRKIEDTPFEMTYWDIRFSNLCNLSCRSCGHIFSSSWYKDQASLAGDVWKNGNRALNYAGRTETDIWEQLLPHIDYVEQIYFAGGEPLMMEEHYLILEELERRGRFDVRLIYNTNFTQVKLKDRYVFDYWKKFDSVAVGASLDAMGPRAEYIRNGTDWDAVERNRERMLETCPGVDFYISPTLSIMNAWHLPTFHRDWVSRGFIRAQDLNVNILQDPAYYRIDVATAAYKDILRDRFEHHLEWLRPLDSLKRATVGFESAIKFMDATDNTRLLPEFWQRTRVLDQLRDQEVLEALPELRGLL